MVHVVLTLTIFHLQILSRSSQFLSVSHTVLYMYLYRVLYTVPLRKISMDKQDFTFYVVCVLVLYKNKKFKKLRLQGYPGSAVHVPVHRTTCTASAVCAYMYMVLHVHVHVYTTVIMYVCIPNIYVCAPHTCIRIHVRVLYILKYMHLYCKL